MMVHSKEAKTLKIKESIASQKATPLDDLLKNEHIENYRQDRNLKGKHASWFMWILTGQLFVMNAVFIISGWGLFHYHHWTLELYMAGTLAQVFGIVLVITKNLFPLKRE